MRIALDDGRELVSEPAEARGSPEVPLADAELRTKYLDLAAPVLSRPRAERIERLVDRLEQADALPPLLDELLQPA